MDLKLKGRRALVTGASQGIGRAVASALAAEGCDLVLVARSADRLAGLADELRPHGGTVHALPADLSRQDEVERVAAMASDVDVLVNNAGAIPPGNLLAVDDKRWREAWDLKVFGYIGLCRALYPALRRQGGVIVNIIGTAGERFDPDYITGSTGNAALMAFTRALGRSAARDGLRVMGINPGPVATDRMERLLRARAQRDLGDAERWAELTRDMPYGRAATPEEIAHAAAFLASPLSAYTNGTILTIDGGP